ncbi:hypothetical protein FQR65_LT20339 [Abscondita terminalis]|nr:hypothetical protein FQR65_LT20339 [Abscondita terminalis]
MANIRSQTPLPIEPAPVFNPVPSFNYAAQQLRSPFLPSSLANELKVMSGKRVYPNLSRQPQPLESYPLESLTLKGSMKSNAGQTVGLIQTPDGEIERVQLGNYMGMNQGRIIEITPTRIDLLEIVPDGRDGIKMKKSLKNILIGDGKFMNSQLRQFTMATVAIAITQVAAAQTTMTNIVPMKIPGQGTEIRVMFNGLPPQPQAYQLDNPSRLVLDFDNAKQNISQASIPVASEEASTVDVAADDQRSRLTVNLKNSGAFTTRVEGNTFILKINNANQAPSLPSYVSSTVNKQNQGIADIGFQRGNAGEGQVIVSLSGANTPVDVQQQGSKVVIRTLGNKIPTHLLRRLNVNDFATPVSSVDAYNEGSNGVITIQSSGSYEYMAFQAENKLTVSLKRPAENKLARPSASQSYTGKKISLDFQDIEVRRVLQLLADFTGINMVAADSYKAILPCVLKDVPWDQALDIILKTKNLDKRRNGNVIWIAPVTELIKAEEDEAKAYAQSIKLAPLQTEYVQLNYAKAIDIEKMIVQGKNSNTTSNTSSSSVDSLGDSVGSFLSPRGINFY